MSAAPRKLAVVEPRATTAVDRAALELELAHKHLAEARADEAEAVGRYDHDESEAAATRAAKARLARERAERRHAARASELEAAKTADAAAQRKADEAEMHDAIAFVSSLPSRLGPQLEALVDLDRLVSGVVDRIADLVVEAETVHDLAHALGERLETPAVVQRSIARPTLAGAALLARIAIALDRKRSGRDLANGWIDAASEPAWDSLDRHAYDAALATLNALEKTP